MRMPARPIFFHGYEAKIAALERHGRQAGPRDRVSKGGAEKRTAAEKHEYIRLHRPYGISVGEGCRLRAGRFRRRNRGTSQTNVLCSAEDSSAPGARAQLAAPRFFGK
jgi:hypothetical protein